MGIHLLFFITYIAKSSHCMSFWAEKNACVFRSRTFAKWITEQKREAFSRSGIWLQISVAYQRNVTFVAVSHEDSLPYPFVAFAPRFYLALRSVKLRLRASHSAQNDRLIDCFVVCGCFWTTFENNKCGGNFCQEVSPACLSRFFCKKGKKRFLRHI